MGAKYTAITRTTRIQTRSRRNRFPRPEPISLTPFRGGVANRLLCNSALAPLGAIDSIAYLLIESKPGNDLHGLSKVFPLVFPLDALQSLTRFSVESREPLILQGFLTAFYSIFHPAYNSIPVPCSTSAQTALAPFQGGPARGRLKTAYRFVAPPFQITTTAQPSAALPPYGCGVPLAGTSLGCDLVLVRPSGGKRMPRALAKLLQQERHALWACLSFCMQKTTR